MQKLVVCTRLISERRKSIEGSIPSWHTIYKSRNAGRIHERIMIKAGVVAATIQSQMYITHESIATDKDFFGGLFYCLKRV